MNNFTFKLYIKLKMNLNFLELTNEQLYIPKIGLDFFLENSIKYLLEYYYVLIYDVCVFDNFEFDKEQLNTHKQFVIKKLVYLEEIIEYKIKREIRDKYKFMENILGKYEIEYIVNNELNKNELVIMTREMLFELTHQEE